MQRSLRAVVAACLAALALVVVACGDDNSGGGGSSGGSEAKKVKVGLVTDVGGLNDRSFNQAANEGLKRAKSQLGIDARVLISKSNADYVPNLSTLARQGYGAYRCEWLRVPEER